MPLEVQEQKFDAFLTDRRRIIVSTNIVMCAVAATFAVANTAAMGFQYFPYPAMLIALTTLGNGIYLLRGGSTDKSILVLLTLLFLGFVLSGIKTGAYQGATLILAPILPMLAVLWRNTRAGWITMLAIGTSLVLMFLLQWRGLIPDNPHSEAGLLVIRFLAVMSTSLVCTWVAWTFARYHQELLRINKQQANTDHLTGIANRRTMESALERELGRARRNNSWISFVMADVDHFKRYNDSNGHLEGDRCLVKVAQVFSNCATRSVDVAGRFGGEEFILILPEIDAKGARHVAEEVRLAMLACDIPYEDTSSDRVSLTLGVVSVQGEHVTTPERLIKLADEALYDGKSAGRNCVISVIDPGDPANRPRLVATA